MKIKLVAVLIAIAFVLGCSRENKIDLNSLNMEQLLTTIQEGSNGVRMNASKMIMGKFYQNTNLVYKVIVGNFTKKSSKDILIVFNDHPVVGKLFYQNENNEWKETNLSDVPYIDVSSIQTINIIDDTTQITFEYSLPGTGRTARGVAIYNWNEKKNGFQQVWNSLKYQRFVDQRNELLEDYQVSVSIGKNIETKGYDNIIGDKNTQISNKYFYSDKYEYFIIKEAKIKEDYVIEHSIVNLDKKGKQENRSIIFKANEIVAIVGESIGSNEYLVRKQDGVHEYVPKYKMKDL